MGRALHPSQTSQEPTPCRSKTKARLTSYSPITQRNSPGPICRRRFTPLDSPTQLCRKLTSHLLSPHSSKIPDRRQNNRVPLPPHPLLWTVIENKRLIRRAYHGHVHLAGPHHHRILY